MTYTKYVKHAMKRIVEGQECSACGNNLYYKNKKTCVTCHMAIKNKQKDNLEGWPKRVKSVDDVMRGVQYD